VMAVERRAPVGEMVEVRCAGCHRWLASVPAGTACVRTRCLKRGCTLYGTGQTIQLGNGSVLE
jgi:hypothetical protein